MTQEVNQERGSTEPVFNEREFLRKARLRSVLRITLISLAVAIGVLLLAFVLPEIMLQKQENRLDCLYPELIRFSEPNTVALGGESYGVRWLGRQKRYYLLRLVGDKPCAAGTLTLDFDAWGGEQSKGHYTFCVLDPDEPLIRRYPGISTGLPEGAKVYLAPYAVPRLEFYHPAVNYEKIRREFGVLETIPRDNLVEMALSFSRPLTLDEMRALLPKELKPMWGAVCAFEDQAYRKNPYLARRLVGNPYLESPEGEKEFITALEALSRIPSYHSDNLKRTVVFLREHGVRYYGVVAVGDPATLQELSRNESITGAVLGIVTPPY